MLIFFEGVASNTKFKTRCPRMLNISTDSIGSLVAVILIFSFAGFGAISKSFNVDAQIVGRVEAAKSKKLTIKSEFGSFEY